MARFSSKTSRTFSGRKPYILFLCTGNTCRSPMAYGILRGLLQETDENDVEIRTAGVMTIPGLLPTQECRQILIKDNLDITGHRSCKMTPDILRRANLILGMTSFHVQMALRMSEAARGKTFLLKEFVGANVKNSQIQDPMGCTLEVYKKVYREIRRACKRLVKMDLITPDEPASATKRKPTKKKTADGEDNATPVAAANDAPKASPAKKGKTQAESKKPKGAIKKKKDTGTAKSKPATKKTAAKKTTAKKPAVKKPAAKKPTAKKTATPKRPSKKAAPTKTANKKPAAKKKPTSKKKKPAAKK